MLFSFVFFLDTYDSNAGVLNSVSEVFEAVLVSFNSFSLYSVLPRLFPPFYSKSLSHSSASVTLLFVPSSVFLNLVIVLLIVYSLILLGPC